MIYEALVKHIEMNNSEWKFGKNLFINQAPREPSFLALIRDNPGGIAINGEVRTERRGSFQLVLRGGEYKSLMTSALQLSDILWIDGVQIGRVLLKVVRPLSEPFSYQLSESSLFEISVNFTLHYGIV